jgi:hypothetical protein
MCRGVVAEYEGLERGRESVEVRECGAVARQ